MERILSFRPGIEKLTTEFCASTHDPARLAPALGELIVGLSGYREEGSKTVPLVFLSTSLESLLLNLKGNDPIGIGSGPLNRTLLKTVLKTCGPLAENHEWAIYIDLGRGDARYGLFRTDRFPLHESTFQRLRGLKHPTPEIIGAQRIGEALIEIRSSQGMGRYIDSSGTLEFSQNPASLIQTWVASVTEDVELNLKLKMESFYHRIAVDVLSAPHGTLSAVIRSGEPVPEFLADGVILKQDFGLANAIRRYIKHRDEAGTLSLNSYSNLIKRMLSMDGITVFSSTGDVLAYNCFVRTIHPHNPKEVILGGARMRAFEIMSKRLGSDLTCALYQSQDGYGQCRTSKKT